jgi:hypothetical protein
VWDRCTCGCWLTGRVAGTVALLAVGLSKRQEQARCAMREDNEYSSAPLASGISAQPPRRARLLRAARLSHRHGGPGQEESPKTPLPSAYGGEESINVGARCSLTASMTHALAEEIRRGCC